MVINYDPPIDAEHYTHRAGRTGRMGRSGMAITLVTDRQTFIMRKFNRELGISIEERALYGGKVRSPRATPATDRGHGPRGSAGGTARKRNRPESLLPPAPMVRREAVRHRVSVRVKGSGTARTRALQNG